jgi:glutamate--cysteine ligase
MTATASIDYFDRSVRERLFVPQPDELRRVGAEIEMLPLLHGSGLPCPLEPVADDGRSTLSFLRPYGEAIGWHERRSPKGSPYFVLPNGTTLTFEPGGQWELCTPASDSISTLVLEACRTLTGLRTAAADAGIALASVGIDPQNALDSVPLQLHSARYVEMTRYFDSIGPSGARMMRQTAATQVSVDPGPDPASRWRLLGDLTPYLTAIFANSPRYAGADTGFQSFRARCWRLLDCSRTGVPHPQLPACEAYSRFALDAVDMTRTDAEGVYRRFGDWASEGRWTEAQWENHLTTLFPEVRPRGHLEVRSIDALRPEMLSAPLVLIAGLVYDRSAADAARDLLTAVDEEMLNRTALCGLHDATIADTAADLVDMGLAGARALGDAVVGGSVLDSAEEFFSTWTLAGRAPADDDQAMPAASREDP